MDNAHYFTPNIKIHPAFGATLAVAEKAGVKVFAYDCMVTEDSLNIGQPVPVKLY